MIRYRAGRDPDGTARLTWVVVEEHREIGVPEPLVTTTAPWDWGEGDATALVEALISHGVGEVLRCETCAGAQMVIEGVDTVPCYTCGGRGVTDAQMAVLVSLRQLLANRFWGLPRLEPWTISDLELHDLVQVLLPAPPPDIVPDEET